MVVCEAEVGATVVEGTVALVSGTLGELVRGRLVVGVARTPSASSRTGVGAEVELEATSN